MAHILDGEWRSFTVKNGNIEGDEPFHIEVDPSNNKLEPKSKHGTALITGEVGQGSNFHHIFANQADPKSNYRGFLFLNGPSMIMVGIARLNIADFQEQEIWIATKP